MQSSHCVLLPHPLQHILSSYVVRNLCRLTASENCSLRLCHRMLRQCAGHPTSPLTSHLLPLNSPPLSKPADHLDRLLCTIFLFDARTSFVFCAGGDKSQHFLWLAHFLSKFCWTTDAWPTFGAPPTRRGQTVFYSFLPL